MERILQCSSCLIIGVQLREDTTKYQVEIKKVALFLYKIKAVFNCKFYEYSK